MDDGLRCSRTRRWLMDRLVLERLARLSGLVVNRWVFLKQADPAAWALSGVGCQMGYVRCFSRIVRRYYTIVADPVDDSIGLRVSIPGVFKPEQPPGFDPAELVRTLR